MIDQLQEAFELLFEGKQAIDHGLYNHNDDKEIQECKACQWVKKVNEFFGIDKPTSPDFPED